MSTDPATERRKILAARILPLARQVLERHRDEIPASGPLRDQIRSLMKDLEPEHAVTSVLGALASAVLDLDQAISQGLLNASDPPGALTAQLFRLAYNRWQKEHRREARLLGAVRQSKSGNSNSPGGGHDLINELPKKNQALPESDARIRELHDYMVETLDAVDVEVWIMYAEGFSETEIAARINRHRTTVNRKVQRFAEIARRFLDGAGTIPND
jgi:DNA-directed RNA polymerase specialized sigma24 family protein